MRLIGGPGCLIVPASGTSSGWPGLIAGGAILCGLGLIFVFGGCFDLGYYLAAIWPLLLLHNIVYSYFIKKCLTYGGYLIYYGCPGKKLC